MDQDLALGGGLPAGESGFDEVKEVRADGKTSLRPTREDELGHKSLAFSWFATTNLESRMIYSLLYK